MTELFVAYLPFLLLPLIMDLLVIKLMPMKTLFLNSSNTFRAVLLVVWLLIRWLLEKGKYKWKHNNHNTQLRCEFSPRNSSTSEKIVHAELFFQLQIYFIFILPDSEEALKIVICKNIWFDVFLIILLCIWAINV